ncbi:hypothetical protein D3C75_1091810 [compost metagenome]
MEILVVTGLRHGVEALDGAQQAGSIDFNLRCQLDQAVGLVKATVQIFGQAPVGYGIARCQGPAGILVTEIGIEHHPARHADDSLTLTGVHGVDDIGIGGRLIDEALPGGVHQDATWQRAFDK